ncbi:MAG TPA: 3-oxoacyl-[acyl-carrier-protein] reductase [Rhodospirillales bacterium]|nr:3-oxoacyl-[acyl-carrier-protein] reductase [Rhodospirillales bacterium]
MFDLNGKRALVTGATGAIGAAIARAFAARGATVGLSGTRLAVLEALAADIGAAARVLPADLSAADGPDALAKAATAALGGVDILVNNAGITRDGLVLRMSDADWDAVLAVDLSSPFRLTRALLRGMVKQRWGRVVGIGSVIGTTGNAGQVNYAAAKAGLVGMTKALAQEVGGRGITVNCVAPGFIESDMTAGLPEARREAVLASVPAGRLGTPADVAACVVFLASDEASYVTGQTLHVNGGMAMPG